MVYEVVIIGGGVGGARVAKILSKEARSFHITLIDKNRYHTFHPNLYEVATSYLPEVYGHMPIDFLDLKFSAIYPLEEIFWDDVGVTFLEGEVVGVDFKKQKVNLKNGEERHYDALVVGAGSETNYFGIPRLYEKALPLKTFYDAMLVRNAIDEAFWEAPKNHIIKIIIAGGGFTGCEFAGELIGFLKKLAEVHGRPKNSYECLIVEAAPSLLGSASNWIQKKAKKRLESMGIKFKFGVAAKSVSDGTLALADGTSLPYDVLIWTAGVKAGGLTDNLNLKLAKASCLLVDEYLRIMPYENVFGVGDITYCVDEAIGKALPMVASVAIREAKYVAENILRLFSKKTPIKYKPHYAGFVIPLGGKYALFESHGIRFAGFLPWILKQLIALHYWSTLLGWRRAFQIWQKGLEIYRRND